jgi:hypothetical protein
MEAEALVAVIDDSALLIKRGDRFRTLESVR